MTENNVSRDDKDKRSKNKIEYDGEAEKKDIDSIHSMEKAQRMSDGKQSS